MSLPNVAQGDKHVDAHNAERALINSLQDVTDPAFQTAITALVQQLIASGGLNAEAVRDLMATVLVAGNNVTITPDDAADKITIGVGSNTLYRGVWGPDAVVYSQDFTGGLIPQPPYSLEKGNRGSLPSIQSIAGPSTTPIPAVQLAANNGYVLDYSTLKLNIAALGLTGVTRVTAWLHKPSGWANQGLVDTEVLRNGAVSYQKNSAFAWEQVSVACDSDDLIEFRQIGKNNGVDGVGPSYVTYIEVRAAAAPYMKDQVVTHNGKLWRSAIDNNGSTPGVDANWVSLLTAPSTGGETFTFTFAGAVTAPYSGALRFYVNSPVLIKRVRASVGVAPTGQDLIIDVNRNGSTLFATQANRPKIASGQNTGYVDPVNLTLAEGDYLSIDIDQVGTTSPGAELVVQVQTVAAP